MMIQVIENLTKITCLKEFLVKAEFRPFHGHWSVDFGIKKNIPKELREIMMNSDVSWTTWRIIQVDVSG